MTITVTAGWLPLLILTTLIGLFKFNRLINAFFIVVSNKIDEVIGIK